MAEGPWSQYSVGWDDEEGLAGLLGRVVHRGVRGRARPVRGGPVTADCPPHRTEDGPRCEAHKEGPCGLTQGGIGPKAVDIRPLKKFALEHLPAHSMLRYLILTEADSLDPWEFMGRVEDSRSRIPQKRYPLAYLRGECGRMKGLKWGVLTGSVVMTLALGLAPLGILPDHLHLSIEVAAETCRVGGGYMPWY